MKKTSLWMIKLGYVCLALTVAYSISAVGISVSVIGVGFILLCILEKKNLDIFYKETKNVVVSMILFLAIMIISLLFSYDKISSIKRVVVVLGYFIIFFSSFLFEDKKFFKTIFYILILASVFHSVYAIVQYFTGIDIMNKGYQKYTRVIGLIGHFNSLAGILGLEVPILFCLFYFLKKQRWVYIIFFLPIFFATILTFTRGVWLGVLVSLVTIAMISCKNILKFVIFFLIVLFSIPPTRQRIINTFRIEETTRKKFISLTLNLLLTKPQRIIFGFGPDSFRKVFYEKYSDFGEKGHFHPHNMYLTRIFETGVVGLVIFFLIFYFFLKDIYKFYVLSKDEFIKFFHLGVIGSITTFLVYGFVDEPFRAHFSPYLLFLLVSLSYKLGLLEQK
ncbi:MAG: O-antigen ligase family protein [Endomicrobiia bacterium]